MAFIIREPARVSREQLDFRALSLDEQMDRFNPAQLKQIYENLFAVQLTEGCTVGCDFCGFDVPRGVRDKIPFNVLERTAEDLARLTKRVERRNFILRGYPKHILPLYDESEPLDYEHDGKNYFHARQLFASKGFDVATTTAIPIGKEELAVAHLQEIDHISISHMNRARLMPYFSKLGVSIYINLASYYRVKFGEDVDCKSPIAHAGQELVEDTVEETIARLRKKDPSLPTKTRFYDLRNDHSPNHDHVQNLDTLCLWCGDRAAEYPRAGKIIDKDEGGLYPSGRAFEMDYLFEGWREYTFCDISGVKLTPSGFVNVAPVHVSADRRTGRMTCIVDPNNFFVQKIGICN